MYQKIKGLCDENSISIAKLERELGFGNGTISKWESASPRADALKAVATYFGVSMESLFEE